MAFGMSPFPLQFGSRGGGDPASALLRTAAAHWIAGPETCFTNDAGTTPAGNGDAVAYQVDSSGNGKHRANTSAGTRPILRQRADGPWYLDFSGGKTLSVPNSKAYFRPLHLSASTLVSLAEWTQTTSASDYISTGTSTSNMGLLISKLNTGAASIAVLRGVAATFSGSFLVENLLASSGLNVFAYNYDPGREVEFHSSFNNEYKWNELSANNAPLSDPIVRLRLSGPGSASLPQTGSITSIEITNSSDEVVYSCDFSAYANTAAMLADGWVNSSTGGATALINNNRLEMSRPIEESDPRLDRSIVLVDDEPHTLTVNGLDSCRWVIFNAGSAGSTYYNSTPFAFTPTLDANNDFTVRPSFGGLEYECAVFFKALSRSEYLTIYSYLRRSDYPIPEMDYRWLIGGQSNASGRGSLSGNVVAEKPAVGAYAYTKGEEYRLLTVPEHSLVGEPIPTDPTEATKYQPAHSWTLRAAKKVAADSGLNILAVPCAIGSTAFSEWDTPETINDRTTLLGLMKHRFDATAGRGIPVFIWYGHENDRSFALADADYVNGGVGTSFQDKFLGLVETLREEIADAPVIYVQLSTDEPLQYAEESAAAGEAQRLVELTGDRLYMVVSHDVVRNTGTDAIHVGRAGMDTLGDRIALAFREHILGEEVDGTGPRIVSVSRSGAVITLTMDKEINTTVGNYGNLFRAYDNGVEATVSSAARGSNTSTVEITLSGSPSGPVTLTYGYRVGLSGVARTDCVKDGGALPLPQFGPIAVPAV